MSELHVGDIAIWVDGDTPASVSDHAEMACVHLGPRYERGGITVHADFTDTPRTRLSDLVELEAFFAAALVAVGAALKAERDRLDDEVRADEVYYQQPDASDEPEWGDYLQRDRVRLAGEAAERPFSGPGSELSTETVEVVAS